MHAEGSGIAVTACQWLQTVPHATAFRHHPLQLEEQRAPGEAL